MIATYPPHWPGLLTHYRHLLDGLGPDEPVLSLHEGNTPLVFAPRLSEALGGGLRLHLKLEGANPSGSFKDRGMVMAMTKAKNQGAEAVVCASTGNTSASMAAYAARAGLRSYMLVPEGKVALGKLAQGLIHGAQVITVRGSFDQALDLVRALGERYPLAIVNSINPHRLEGQQCAAFELVDQLGQRPDVVALPVGNAGNVSAYAKGFRRYEAAGLSRGLPIFVGVQAAGAAPLVSGQVVPHPETVATAIRIGNPASWDLAVEAVQSSAGHFRAVSDEEILAAQRRLAQEEGIFAEPASCAPIAGLLAAAREGMLPRKGQVVAILTGHGLKDPTTAIAQCSTAEAPSLPAELKAVAGAMGF